LKQRQIEKSADGGTKIFIIDTQFINHHAQNALLKTFEEPSPDTHFFVIMPSIRSLYTTLVSRFMVLGSTENIIDTEEAQAFLKLDISKKLLFIADIIKAHESDDNSGALRAHATRLISGVETLLYESSKKNNTKLDGSLFQNFANAKKYLDIAGASVKMILEQIALVV